MFTWLFTSTPLAFFIQSFWRDEAFSFFLAKKNIFEIIVLTVKDFNPPFYYLTLHFWMKIFGSSEIALRSLSLLFYVLTIYIIYDFLKDIFKLNRYKTFTYLLLFIFNPVLIYYGFEARMYSMFAFFATASFYFFITKNKKYYLLISILGLYTHYFMIFVLLSQILYLLISHPRPLKLKMVLFPYLVFSPWLIFMILQKNDILNPFWIATAPFKTILFLPFVIFSGYENGINFPSLYIYFSIFLLLIILIGIFKFSKKKYFNFFLIWTFLPLLITGIISLYRPIILPRYLIFSTVGFIFLIVYILNNIKTLPRIIFFTLILAFIFIYQQKDLKYRRKNNIAKQIKKLKTTARKEDLIYISNVLDYFTIQYYFGENKVYLFNQDYNAIPSYVGKILIPKEKFVNTLPAYPKRAFILKNNWEYDIISTY